VRREKTGGLKASATQANRSPQLQLGLQLDPPPPVFLEVLIMGELKSIFLEVLIIGDFKLPRMSEIQKVQKFL
jgi:hypothetical protein